uniref:Uncharacterized protein n=1 Tax=Trichobilharzia regenti TaxID=157069 RepID=A0AA85JPX4_TRIRE|nr:unnamed protein product [Trichobilharzia regenti]
MPALYASHYPNSTSTTKNCPKNIEHMKHVKSSDMVACLTSSVTGHIPPMCLPPSGNYCCSHTPPTPIRRPWLGDNNNTEQITSVRSRSGVQKRSVYVNASIYPIPEMLRHPDSNNGYGHNRCSRIRDRQNSYENANSINMNPTSISTVPTSNNNNNSDNVGKTTQNASNPQIPYWTHLLPYRTSTVPQNLSGRLRKSETLPNDWISTYESNKLTECEKYPLSKSTSYQLKNTLTNQNAHNSSQCSNNYYSDESKPHHSNDHDTGINGKGAKSPPPRPPIRTSSHGGISSRQTPVSQPSTSPYCQHLSCQKQQHTQGLSISSTNANNSINESPILCRYSQLYSLNSCHHNSSLSNNSPSNNTTSSNGCHSTSQHQKHPPSAHTHQYSSNEHPSAHPPHRQQFIQCPIQSHSIPSSQMNHHSKS